MEIVKNFKDKIELLASENENKNVTLENIFKTFSKVEKYILKDIKKNMKKPKRPKSAYIYFSRDKREEVKHNNPKFTPKEIIKELSKQWRLAKETNSIKIYENMARIDKERYNKEKKSNLSKNKFNNLAKPVKSRNSYICFCNTMKTIVKKENPEFTSTDIIKELRKKWKIVKNSDEIDIYIDMANKDKIRYEEEMKEYNSVNVL